MTFDEWWEQNVRRYYVSDPPPRGGWAFDLARDAWNNARHEYVQAPATAEAVYAALRKHELSFTSRENVAAVLNALARIQATQSISNSPTKGE